MRISDIPRIVQCPNCNAPAQHDFLLSGNTSGATQWSDGKVQCPMLPKMAPDVTRCRSCGQYYWLCDAQAEFFGEKSEFPHPIPSVYWPTPDELAEVADSGVAATPGRALVLRVLIWWAFNDRQRRPTADRSADPTAAAERNMEELLTLCQEYLKQVDERSGATPTDAGLPLEIAEFLGVAPPPSRTAKVPGSEALDDEAPSERCRRQLLLIMAELERELGRFDQCVETLEGVAHSSAKQIRSWASAGEQPVRRLNEGFLDRLPNRLGCLVVLASYLLTGIGCVATFRVVYVAVEGGLAGSTRAAQPLAIAAGGVAAGGLVLAIWYVYDRLSRRK